MSSGKLLQHAVERIERARGYTLALLADVADEDWFRQPSDGVTHIAWQVGHLAMAEYAICLARRRGSEPDDKKILSREFRRHFGKGSTPDPDPAANPTPAEIRDVLAGVHARVLEELAEETEEHLTEQLAAPHEMFNTKLEALHFCADHEMLHAGQIGLLRRLIGKEPVR